eukprot:GFUD01131697.1.p1 GENE.GFUD01131697.1~~GFUD01131697.1.p1  ORF type:complete len:194 (-),score=76.22 GFUD01131697.1:167-748(-)
MINMDITCNQLNADQMFPRAQVLTVVGGRVITSCSSNGQFHLNGQQLMMQLDSLTSSMMDMAVNTEEVEMEEVNEENIQHTKKAKSTMFIQNIESYEHSVEQQMLKHHQELEQQQQYELEQQQQYELDQQQQYELEQQQHQMEHQRQLQLEQQGKLLQQQLPNFGVSSRTHSTSDSLKAIPEMSGPQKCSLWA